MINNSIIIAGIVSFFLIEKMISNYLGTDAHTHDHGSSQTDDKKDNKKKDKQAGNKTNEKK